jgi:hypothetical protein
MSSTTARTGITLVSESFDVIVSSLQLNPNHEVQHGREVRRFGHQTRFVHAVLAESIP